MCACAMSVIVAGIESTTHTHTRTHQPPLAHVPARATLYAKGGRRGGPGSKGRRCVGGGGGIINAD